MTRYIDADALKKSIDEHVYLVNHGFNETEYGCTQYGIHQIIDDAPTIDAVPVKRGKWTHDGGYFKNRWICSECGYKWFSTKESGKFCPNCGARMDEE